MVGPTQRALRQFVQREGSDVIQTAAQKKVTNEANESLLEKATVDFYGEGLTGGAQEAVQIIGQDYLGEVQDLTTNEVVSRILDASSAEAFGGLGGTTVAQFTEIANKQLDAQSQRIAADHIKYEIENSPLTPKQKVEFEQRIDELMSEINPVTGRVYTEAEATIRAAQEGATTQPIDASQIPPQPTEEEQSGAIGDTSDPVQQAIGEVREQNKNATTPVFTEIPQTPTDPKLVGEEVPIEEEESATSQSVLEPDVLGVDSTGTPVFTPEQVTEAQAKIPAVPTIDIESIRETYEESVAEEIVEVSKKIIDEGNLAGVSIPVGDALARAETEVTENRDPAEVLKTAEIQPTDVAPTDAAPTEVTPTEVTPTDAAPAKTSQTPDPIKDARNKIADQEVTIPKVKLPKKKKNKWIATYR